MLAVIHDATSGAAETVRFSLTQYGVVGIWIILFGSNSVLISELQVLASREDQVASDFKKATQDESNMVAVAVMTPSEAFILGANLTDN